MNLRKAFLITHPEVSKVAPSFVSISKNIQNPSSTDIVYISAEFTNATIVNLKVSNNPNESASDYISISMLDDGLAGDLTAGDNIYTAAIPYTASNDNIKYYV